VSADDPIEFQGFPKIARLQREIVVTEKIDGTNAAIGITDDGRVYAQSRKRLITTDDDNYGFARWVAERADELADELGPGLHFGEWWGQGIQRTYGMEEKVFSLFNVHRWGDAPLQVCRVVPVLARHNTFSERIITHAITRLQLGGSLAAPGYPDPEGIVIFHKASNSLFKQTLVADDKGKEHGA
jgi:hypothetical protein